MPVLVTITGPSLSGKTTLEQALAASGCAPLVSTTTRPMRAGEVEGKAYYFKTKEEFFWLEDNGMLVENVRFNGNSYGLTKFEFTRLQNHKMPVIAVVEPHGRDQLVEYARSIGWQTMKVWVNSPDEIKQRFTERFRKDILKDVTDGSFNLGSIGRIVNVHIDRKDTAEHVESDWIKEALYYPYTLKFIGLNADSIDKVKRDILYCADNQ